MFMKCPVDSATLSMTDRSGVEIDYCPECRGVWLDRGELDKIIDSNSKSIDSPQPDRQQNQRTRENNSYHHNYDNGHHYKKKKKENFLSDLFDF